MTLKRGKILIADDNEDILFTLKILLRPIAESISITTDPRELLPILSRTHYDVILLDMNFRNDAVSGREGFHWLEEILKLDSGAVVIFITLMPIPKRLYGPSSSALPTSSPSPGKTIR